MIEQLANHIVDYDPAAVLRRTQDTMRYIQAEWSKEHTESIDEDALRLFLCDEHCGDLTEKQKALARRCRDEMRNVYGAAMLRLLLCEEMLRRNMVQDFLTYRRVFGPELGTAPWMLDRDRLTAVLSDLARLKRSRRKERRSLCASPPHKCPQCGHFQGFSTGDNGTLL